MTEINLNQTEYNFYQPVTARRLYVLDYKTKFDNKTFIFTVNAHNLKKFKIKTCRAP